jgi:hypothetical protein
MSDGREVIRGQLDQAHHLLRQLQARPLALLDIWRMASESCHRRPRRPLAPAAGAGSRSDQILGRESEVVGTGLARSVFDDKRVASGSPDYRTVRV